MPGYLITYTPNWAGWMGAARPAAGMYAISEHVVADQGALGEELAAFGVPPHKVRLDFGFHVLEGAQIEWRPADAPAGTPVPEVEQAPPLAEAPPWPRPTPEQVAEADLLRAKAAAELEVAVNPATSEAKVLAAQLEAELFERQAELLEAAGLAEHPALFDLGGNLVAAKLINNRWGNPTWMVLDSDDPINGKPVMVDGRPLFVSAFPARRETIERKGYREGVVRVATTARVWTVGRGKSRTAAVVDVRLDGGFARDAVVLDDGRG